MNALELAEQLRDLSTKFKTPSHEKGVCNGAIQELRRLHAINAELVKTLEAIENNAGIEGMVGFKEWAKSAAHFAVKKAKQ